MKMERRITGIIYILVTFALITEMSINVQAKDTHRRRRPKENTTEKPHERNVCNATERVSKVHCYCGHITEPKNATNAECWIFNGGVLREDPVWQSFASQPALQILSFNVRIDGTLGFVPTEAFQHLQNLSYLNFKYGEFVQIPSYSFANLTSVKVANLSTNQIENIQQYAFAHLPNITTIDLEDNMITEIGMDHFVDVPNLQKLILTKNNISSIKDGAFRHTNQLEELDLNKNNICDLNRLTFDGLDNLRKLDLQRNRIRYLIDYTFAELWNLRELLLGKNDLRVISSRTFDGLYQLDKLSLADNKLVTLPSGWLEGARDLSSLDLRSNELHALTFQNIQPIFDKLKPQNSNLLLEDNKFVCNCRMDWMHSLRTETSSPNTKASLDGITCNMESTVLSYAHNIPDPMDNKDILHAGLTTEKSLSKNFTAVDKQPNDLSTTKTGVKRYILKIPPGTLPCPKEIKKNTTEKPPNTTTKPVIPIQIEMETFRLYDDIDDSASSSSSFAVNILMPWSGVFYFILFFT